MTALEQLRPLVGTKQACQALAVPRATWYRKRRVALYPAALPSGKRQRHSPRALSDREQSTVLACLHEERFQDCSPAQVCPNSYRFDRRRSKCCCWGWCSGTALGTAVGRWSVAD